MAYFILSCDGGGIRGLIGAMIINQLQRIFPLFLPQVNLFAGTSTGSFLALGLASGLYPQKLVDLYLTQGQTIFQPYGEIGDSFDYVEYVNSGLYSVLSGTLTNPQLTLSQLSSKALVTTFQLQGPRTWQPLLLHNLTNSPTGANTTIIDAAMASSAAPTYFQPYPHPYYSYCVDGGVAANNPGMAALASVIDPALENVPLANVWMLSIGTGTPPDSLPTSAVDSTGPLNYGVKNWMWPWAVGNTPSVPLLTALFDAPETLTTYQCQNILGPRYQRADLELAAPYALDDWQDIGQLKALVNQYFGYGQAPAQNWVDTKNWIAQSFNLAEEPAPRCD